MKEAIYTPPPHPPQYTWKNIFFFYQELRLQGELRKTSSAPNVTVKFIGNQRVVIWGGGRGGVITACSRCDAVPGKERGGG